MGLPAKLSITNSNYYGFKKISDIPQKQNVSLENLVTLRVSTGVGKNGTLNADIGGRIYKEWDENGEIKEDKRALSPMLEVKYKHKCGNFNFAGRYRNYSEPGPSEDEKTDVNVNQFRAIAGYSYPISEELSCYADANVTAKVSTDDEYSHDYKCGVYCGASYKPKWLPGAGLWGEAQLTGKLKKLAPNEQMCSYAFNFGVTYNF